jgi:hypothetical protein
MSWRGTIKSSSSHQLEGWRDFRRPFAGGELPGEEAMEAMGTARPCDFIRWRTRTMHDADFESDLLIQNISSTFASCSGRSSILAGDGPHRFEPCSNAAGETPTVTVAPIGDHGAVPKRYEE